MSKMAVGLALGFVIGASCRWFDIPAPSPPKLTGALLVFAMTLGYVAVDWWLAARLASQAPTTTGDHRPGPTG
jgi:XapX domain-containing protein